MDGDQLNAAIKKVSALMAAEGWQPAEAMHVLAHVLGCIVSCSNDRFEAKRQVDIALHNAVALVDSGQAPKH